MRHIEAQLIHDMRNAVSVIQGAADTLHDAARTMTPEAVEHVAAMLVRRGEILARLLQDLAIVHEIDRGALDLRLQEVDVADAVRDCVGARPERLDSRVTIEIDPNLTVLADRVRLAQVLDNLVCNAVRYGGPHVVVRAVREGDLVRIAVTDDGVGVDPELVGTVFDMYSRGDQSRELGGSGLGLAIVQQLCEAMGGSVAYDGADGAAFVASLPAGPRSGRQRPVSVLAGRDALAD